MILALIIGIAIEVRVHSAQYLRLFLRKNAGGSRFGKIVQSQRLTGTLVRYTTSALIERFRELE